MATLTRRIAADADTVFRTVADLDGLPIWNRAITRVCEAGRSPLLSWHSGPCSGMIDSEAPSTEADRDA